MPISNDTRYFKTRTDSKCPNCGEYEFVDNEHCNKCGFTKFTKVEG